MPRIHEMPTHPNVEDTLLGALTPGQVARLAARLSLAYRGRCSACVGTKFGNKLAGNGPNGTGRRRIGRDGLRRERPLEDEPGAVRTLLGSLAASEQTAPAS